MRACDVQRVMGGQFVSIQDTLDKYSVISLKKTWRAKYANTLGLLDVGDIVGVKVQ